MTFNQSLIEKARKGEIAILNDGSVEELREILARVWPHNISDLIMGCDKLYRKIAGEDAWIGSQGTNLPAHSVKDFFMNTKDPESLENTVQPRTYRVTRQQMKEIWNLPGRQRHTDPHHQGLADKVKACERKQGKGKSERRVINPHAENGYQ